MSATKYTNMSNNYHYKTESFIQIYNKTLRNKMCGLFFKKKVLIFIMPFCSHTSSTVIKQDITENNMNTEMLKQTQLLADNHTELKFSLCSLYVF